MLPVPLPSLVNGDRGSIYMNRARLNVRGAIAFVPEDGQIPVAVPVRTGLANGMSSCSICAPDDSFIEIMSLARDVGAASADVIARTYVLLSEYANGYQRQWMPRPVNCEHVFGSGQNPFSLDDPFSEFCMLRPQGQLSIQVINSATGGETALTPSAEGRRIGLQALKEDRALADGMKEVLERRKFVYPYWLPLASSIGSSPAESRNVPGLTVAASGQATAQFCTYSGFGELVLTRLMATALNTGVAGDVTNLFKMDLYDHLNRRLNKQPIIFPAGAGTAQFPYVLPTPLNLKSNEVYWVRVFNLVTDAAIDVSLTFQGVACDFMEGGAK